MQAQKIENQVISAAGVTTQGNSEGYISWTVGESLIGTVQVHDKMLTQGFHQPYLIDCDFDFKSTVDCIGNDEYLLTVKTTDSKEYILSDSDDLKFKGQLNEEGQVLGPFDAAEPFQAKLQLVNQSYCSKAISVNEIDCQTESFQILSAKGDVKTDGNLISWTTFGTLKNGSVVLEKLNDNGDYVELHSYQPSTNNFDKAFVDVNADLGLNSYRIVEYSNNEIIDQKEVALMRVNETARTQYTIETYPNPVVDFLTVYLKDYDYRTVLVSFFTVNGNSIMAREMEVIDNKIRLNVKDLDISLYLLSIATPDGKLMTTQKIQKID